MNDDKFFEKGLKGDRLQALIFLGIVIVVLSIIFSFSIRGVILTCDKLSIIGAIVSGILIFFISGIVGFCSFKKKGG